jgi:aromatic-L-amino-acid/L-tryptophan decarboxylase
MAKRPEPVPDFDWDPARARELGAEVVELWTELLARLPDLPVGGNFTAQKVREELDLDVPEEGLSNAELVARLRPLVFDQSIYPGHPGFFAYISGAGTVPGAAADLIASALNQNLGGFRLSPGANQVEAALVNWLAQSFRLPEGAGGQVVAGGAMANFVGLKVARDRALGRMGAVTGWLAGPGSPSMRRASRTWCSAAPRTCWASGSTPCARSRWTTAGECCRRHWKRRSSGISPKA